ncbi:MAG: 4-hydroxyphenylpyruvate dioxygenase [Bdellovibrionaceae bacterium]|nr:4-hydroxyphenylpyruvate dioxygenase [Pseudobdellovibrionaceae bacterium]
MADKFAFQGVEFVEYATPKPEELAKVFYSLGFKKIGQHKTKEISLFRAGSFCFIINSDENSFAANFKNAHGPSACAMAFRVKNAQEAFDKAVKRGATPFKEADHKFLAVYGVGQSLIYFVDKYKDLEMYKEDFDISAELSEKRDLSLLSIDHLTNNVAKGSMQKVCDFYAQTFDFTEVRYFDIKGKQTGLLSKVMRSPCGTILIPVNEPSTENSQIQEYLDVYNGAGIQHIAFLTNDIVKTVSNLKKSSLKFLSIPDTYYETLLNRVPQVKDSLEDLKQLKILADGDKEGYLLQIFTENQVGPIFFEIIQRKNHFGFGEGNFQALFESMEEDQKRRGFL